MSDYEKRFYDIVKNQWEEARYCIDDPKKEIYLSGNRESTFLKLPSSWFNI